MAPSKNVIVRGLKYGMKNPGTTASFLKVLGLTSVASYAGWKVLVKGEGLDEVAAGVLGEETKENYKKHGLVGAFQGKFFGQDGADKSVAENVVDAAVGDGTYQKAGETIKSAVDGTRSAISSAGDYVRGRIQGQPGSAQNRAGYEYPSEDYSGILGMNNPFSSIPDLVGNVTGGKMTSLNLVGLIAACYMVFGGRFGWLGKIAGVMLGGYTAKNMVNRQQQRQMQMVNPYLEPYQYAGAGRYPMQPDVAHYADQTPVEHQGEDPSRGTVHRLRM